VAFLTEEAPRSDDPKRNHLERRFLLHIATDQVDFIRGAGRFRVKDLRWAVPLAAATGLTLSTDPPASRNLAGNNPDNWNTQSKISDIGLVTAGALAGGAYLWGVTSHDDHKRETGVLAIEAATNALIDNEAIKQIFRRDRPTVGTGEGLFFNSPVKFPSDGSFVSGHAMISWSIASVIAHEYPGWLTQSVVYGLATMTSATRVTGKKHFPTDVLLGAATGWYIGHQVYRAHHNPDLPGMDLGTFEKAEVTEGKARNLGSTYVPLESWVYDAMDRLAGLGLLSTNLSNMRPWTRLECARLVQEAESNVSALDLPDESLPAQIVRELREEFDYEYQVLDGKENKTAAVESLYARVTAIGGSPVRDGYHFGQTIYNDDGRPYAEGGNFVGGGSAYAVKGPWSVYFRAEGQHSPSSPPIPVSAQNAISAFEGTPLVPGFQLNDINRARVLDAYAALTWRKWQFSFGKQSLWWSPDQEGAMNYSNNAEPVNMFRVSTVMPLHLPWIFKYLGPTKGELFLGQLEGHTFIRTNAGLFGPNLDRQPYIEGIKAAFKPTPNFEFGVSFTSVWGGQGVPITWDSFIRSFSPGNTFPGQPLDPGDRRTGFDFKYRLPGLRRWLTLYNDSMAEDEINPIGYPRRSSHAPGLYLSHVPKIPKLDLRGEAYYTDLPGLRGTGVWYFNNHYLSGYTNEGFLLGHPVGRQGYGYTVKSTYWFAPRKTVTFGYRRVLANHDFLEGGSINDYSARAKWRLCDDINVDAGLQYEQWRFPLLAPTQQTNVTGSIGVVFTPKWRWR
jgi:membrane-associated phospholipid phosphatase